MTAGFSTFLNFRTLLYIYLVSKIDQSGIILLISCSSWISDNFLPIIVYFHALLEYLITLADGQTLIKRFKKTEIIISVRIWVQIDILKIFDNYV